MALASERPRFDTRPWQARPSPDSRTLGSRPTVGADFHARTLGAGAARAWWPIRSSKPAGRSSPPLGWFDSIAAPWLEIKDSCPIGALAWCDLDSKRVPNMSRASAIVPGHAWLPSPSPATSTASSASAARRGMRGTGCLTGARCRSTQARRPVLVPAQPRRGLRPPAAVADGEEAAPARDPRRRGDAEGHQHRHLGDQAADAHRRARAREAGRGLLQADGLGLAGSGGEEDGRERDTGARIDQALEGQVARQVHEPQTPALRHVIDSRPRAA
jgi:hypothetical protein